ncbi:MAG: urate oxidase [Terrimicrobiaceae bacterium]|nr:urate oxidase [Terrimicrobiaceae bacterium]
MATLGANRYGKQKVRVLRKLDNGQSVVEISADALLEGTFDRSYLGDDNTQVVATDTVKNTIIALAHQHLGPVIEEFALRLGRHFLARHAHVDRVFIELRERRWERMVIAGQTAPHSFHASPLGEPYTKLALSRVGCELESGIRGLLVLNSTHSAFRGFDHTEFTTLVDADDRILSTVIEAGWTFLPDETDYRSINERVLAAMLEVFATRFSPSVQRTLFEMGEAALQSAPGIARIAIRMPNKHYFPANLSAFGIENPNITFLPQDEPHGQIEAIVRR